MKTKILGLAAVAALLVPSLQAAPVAVPNFSFEDTDVADGATGASNSVTGWTPSNGNFGNFDPQDNKYAGTTGNTTPSPLPDGFQLAFTFGGATVTSAASVITIADNTTYTLTVATGAELGSNSTPSISLLAGTTLIGTTNSVGTPGSLTDTTFTFTTGTGDALSGQGLFIQLGGGGTPEFDNVRLDATAVPEPSTWVMMVAGLGALGFVQSRRRRA